LLEYEPQTLRVGLRHREDDTLARKLPRLVFEAHFHKLFPLLHQRVAVTKSPLDVGAGIVDAVRIDTLLD
jgi:hypothetical protein